MAERNRATERKPVRVPAELYRAARTLGIWRQYELGDSRETSSINAIVAEAAAVGMDILIAEAKSQGFTPPK